MDSVLEWLLEGDVAVQFQTTRDLLHHLAGDAIIQCHDGRSAIARGQDAIIRARRAAALEMAQHHAAAILAGDLAELLGDGKADAA